MKKIRVYELAKDLNIESKVLVDFLQIVASKNHMSTIETTLHWFMTILKTIVILR